MGDDDIRAALRRGADDTAFDLLVRAHGRTVLGRCHEILRDHGLAEDAMQATLVKVLRERSQLHSVVNLRAWLMQVASRTALDVRRSARRHDRRVELLRAHGDDEGAVTPAPARADPARDQAALHACLDELEPDLRAALLMRYQDDASWDDIAAALGLRVDAVRMRVKRALPGLQACLARQGVEP